ncbi:MAG: outer membrane beta-barrel domain-containing protein [Burkholderiaceae bacterium]
MTLTILRNTLLAFVTLATCIGASAAELNTSTPSATSPTEQVVVPEVTRRDIKVPRMPSKDFEVGLFGGTYATQNFGSSFVKGLRLGYHISEDFFVEGVYGETKVSDEMYRQVLPGGVFPNGKNKLQYYNISAGYNVLPGEVFFGANHASPFALYLIGGVGTTLLNDQRMATFNFGTGMRVFYNDNVAIQIDARDHVFSLDLLGKKQTTQNIELSLGLTVSF